MNLIGSSINHKTAPIELRESLYLSADEIKNFIPRLKKDIFSAGFIISTCNRTEIFGIPHDDTLQTSTLIDYLLDYKPVDGIDKKNFQSYFNCSRCKTYF
jgi:glutamyl-tRNA reductase